MIRALTSDDLGACVDLFVSTFAAAPWGETWRPEDAARRLSGFLATPDAHGVVLTGADGRALGFALGHVERFEAEDHFLLKEMCVAADHRREGIGTRLLEALSEAVPEVRHWLLLTARDSPAAAFYERHGFRSAQKMGVYVRP